MGVYIKNLEMPETCKSCYLSKLDVGLYAYVCQPTGVLIDCDIAKNKRLIAPCPLVLVPPHIDSLVQEVEQYRSRQTIDDDPYRPLWPSWDY